MCGKGKAEKGYVLLESLVGLVLLSVIALSLVTALPLLLDASARLDVEQSIYHRLAEIHIQELNGEALALETDGFRAVRIRDRWCAVYVWRDEDERTICL